MAKKAKSLNPADAFRKAQRQKEIKRNKLDRKKAREDAHSKKDSSAIQAEISQLERLSKPTLSEQNRLKEARNELSLILKAKQQKGITTSTDATPSTSKVIIDPATGLPAVPGADNRNDADKSGHTSSNTTKSGSNSRTMNWFGPDGKLLEPEKSFYYHPVFNPFGVPPPGMPMRMKDSLDVPSGTSSSGPVSSDLGPNDLSQTQPSTSRIIETKDVSEKEGDSENESEEDESDEDTEDDEDDIPLPEGSPPASESEDDEIPLPDGPPPPKPLHKPRSDQLLSRPTAFSENIRIQGHHPHSGLAQSAPYFPPPISLVPGLPPPPMIAGMSMRSFPLGPNGLPLPPPPINHFHSLPPPPTSANLPAKPELAAGPLKGVPTPGAATPAPKPTIQASATVTALPQLRDLKREATSFVPAAIRKKRKELDRRAGLAGLGDGNRIQAAPSSLDPAGEDPSESKEPKQVTTTLLAALKRDGVVSDTPVLKGPVGTVGAEKDDYEKFVESLGDVL
ncbi:hypothetical protein PGT21_034471 [Puccinia graminis f. sp. tritici]|uniref:Wbp11/ELF5/Saf1 N-terminal domain-containing protein n=2 Tax=Puccinia graminis f. sp. tritici TaxID=56615 RepID=A0A5B0N115_PUCGR|nr:hypothetical protein PGT21_034471 [Puccinia graminis f. sp. tritici]KAA1081779.1 hypothetical protein PGTUg99_006238 [Puccinia graminis f. sp. tritici]